MSKSTLFQLDEGWQSIPNALHMMSIPHGGDTMDERSAGVKILGVFKNLSIIYFIGNCQSFSHLIFCSQLKYLFDLISSMVHHIQTSRLKKHKKFALMKYVQFYARGGL